MNKAHYFRNLALWLILSVISVCTLGVIFYFAWLLVGKDFSLIAQTPTLPQSTIDISSVTRQPTPTQTLSPEPTFTLTATIMLTPTQIVYVVREGETLTTIAQAFGVSVELLKQYNGLQDDMIYTGQSLMIPPPGWVPLAATPTPEFSQTPSNPENSFTQSSLGENRLYTVMENDSLPDIAAKFSLTVDDIRLANGMIGDNILVGQSLYIPEAASLPAAWVYSSLSADPYIQKLDADRFSLHFVPETYPSKAAAQLAVMEQNALNFLEQKYGQALPGNFDLYIAGSLFAPPDRGLRGRSFSAAYQNFVLFDGSGNPVDEQYMLAHELTHLYMWNVFGAPSTTLISEGAAVYSGTELIAGQGELPLEKFCAAHLLVGALPKVSGSLTFEGHNFDLENYYAAGCFVGYLANTYGAEKVGLVYPSSDYAGVFGKSLSGLEEEWRAYLSANVSLDGVDSQKLVDLTREITAAYENFFGTFDGSTKAIRAYRELDTARMALLENRLDDAQSHLDAFHTVLNTP